MIKQVIALDKENARIKTMERMKFGWWYLRYAFAIEPMAAFGIWESEYKHQFPEYDDYSTWQMVNVYSENHDLMPKSFIVSVIDAVSYAFCLILGGLSTFLSFLSTK
jgi:hypothetical protein